MQTISGNLRYALRQLRHSPQFTILTVVTLALGIGANAAIFNLLNAVIVRSLPVPDAEQLRLLSVTHNDEASDTFSVPILRQMQASVAEQARIAGFSAISAMRTTGVNGDTEPIHTQLVTGNFFDVLGVKPQSGRLLLATDDSITNAFPAVLSGAFWAKRFGSDPSVVGRFINVNDTPIRIAGVAPASFFGVSPSTRPDIWLPLAAQSDLRFNTNVWNSNGDSSKPFLTQPEIRWLSAIARIPIRAAAARTTVIVNQIYARDMEREVKGWTDPVAIRRLLDIRIHLDAGDKGLASLRQQFFAPITVLMCAAGLVLLIACVNLASLMLARVVGRKKEFAIRRSLGATGRCITGQLIAEVMLLSIAGSVIAMPVAVCAGQLLVSWASSGNPIPLDVGINPSLVIFVGAAAVITCLVLGLLPAFEAVHFPLADAMKAHASSVKGRRLPWGRTLIVVQVTFSFVLLTGAVLFVRTFLNYMNLDLGFTPEHILSVRVDPNGARYKPEQLLPLYHRILDRLTALPGVQSASFTNSELAAGPWRSSGIGFIDRPDNNQTIQELFVNPSFFSTVGMRLVAGRFFDARDTGLVPVLAVVNEATARKYFPHESPLGRRFGYGDDRYKIIGVVADARINNVHGDVDPTAFYSLEQSPEYANGIEIRAQGSPTQIERSVRAAIHESAPGLPVMRIRVLTEILTSGLVREKLVARLSSAFALLALGLACLGIYGVLSYAITRRTSEIGIRLALGAEGGQIRWMVLREALAVIFLGLGIGIPIAIAATRFIKGLLYGLSPTDPASLAAGALTLFAIGLLAAFIPAWRASRIDPSVALRNE